MLELARGKIDAKSSDTRRDQRGQILSRPRYPSDDRRLKIRPHAKVHLTIRNHPDPEYAEVFDDPMLRGVWTGLLVIAVGAFAGKTNDTVTLSQGDLVWLTGRSSASRAEPILLRLCSALGYECTKSGRRWVVKIRNLKRKQGLDYADRGTTPRTTDPSESDSDSDTDTKKKKKNPTATAAGGLPASKEDRTPTAVGLFMDTFERRKRIKYALAKRDPALLKPIYESLGRNPRAFGEMLEQFFALDDPRMRERGWSVTALNERWQGCHIAAQKHSRIEQEQREREEIQAKQPPLPHMRGFGAFQ